MTKLLIVGGRQRRNALDLEEWQAYDQARVVQLDSATGEVRERLTYVTPPEHCAPESPAIVFKAGTLVGDRLWLCTMTEVLVWNHVTEQIEHCFSHPTFNDLHHVLPLGETRYCVANTGLDQAVQMNGGDRLEQAWNLADVPTWERFDESQDYRRIASTKPHAVHANFIFEWDEELWATRFHCQDAIALGSPDRRIDLSQGGPHDGILIDGALRFTVVQGSVATVSSPCAGESKSRCPETKWTRLQPPDKSSELLGWCRGICTAGDSEVWIGFSRLRPTKMRSNLSWIKHGFQRVGQHATRPTRIARYDLTDGRCLEEIDLEPYGLNAVFGIYALPS